MVTFTGGRARPNACPRSNGTRNIVAVFCTRSSSTVNVFAGTSPTKVPHRDWPVRSAGTLCRMRTVFVLYWLVILAGVLSAILVAALNP